MSANINTLLEELYALEPSLKAHEKEIIRIIKAMMKNTPKVDIDQSFREELRAKIESEIGVMSGRSSWSWGWPTLSGFLACTLLGVFVWNTQQVAPTSETALISFQPEIKQVAANAFKVTNANNRPQGGGGGMGGREMAMNNPAPMATSVSDTAIAPVATDNTVVVGTDAIATKMIAPDTMIYPPMDFPLYNYVYSGELKLPTEPQTVYKKSVAPFNISETRSIIASLNIDSVNLGAMSNLGVSNISLMEDRDYGYMTNIDFITGTVSINQNWLKWPQPVCDSRGCEQPKPLAESDIPADTVIRAAADAFLRKFSINTSAYGEPIIDSSWRMWYARSSEMGQVATVPEMYTITYPFMLDGQIVYEEGGMARGLSLNYDVRSGRITSFYGLEKQSLESSQYPAIADMALVQKMIKQGTRYISDNRPVEPKQKVVDVALGEPKIGYLHVYGEWKNGRSDEFLVPAWIFPVTGKTDTNYYMPTTVTIPLVADFVQKVDWANPMPMPLTEPATVDPAVTMDAGIKE